MINQEPPTTRTRLVEAARQLFLEEGYATTSVSDILRAAGANSGSLYHFFATKQDLLLEVLDSYRCGIQPMLLQPAWKTVDDPLERIFALLGRYRELLVASDFRYGCPIGSLALELHEPDPPVRELLVANFNAWTDAVAGCVVASGIAQGAAARELAMLILSVMEGGVMQSRTFRNPEPFDASVRQLRKLLGARSKQPRSSQRRSRLEPKPKGGQ